MAVMGQHPDKRRTQVKTLLMRDCSEGGNQPGCLFLRLAKRGFLLPGSSLIRSGSTRGARAAYFKMIVNGKRRKTAALPCLSKRRAYPGWTGLSGCLLVSSTKTFDMHVSFRTSPCG